MEVNLNDIENMVNNKYFTPYVINTQSQLSFTKPEDVRQYVKGNGQLPPHVMMQRMMEAFFGHYETCLISDKKTMVVMFGKLFSGWVSKLYEKNKELETTKDITTSCECDKKINEHNMQLDQMHKRGNDDIKRIMSVQKMSFRSKHRTLPEIKTLITKYCFVVASRYYSVPLNSNINMIGNYRALREALIMEWYIALDDVNLTNILNPDVLFKKIDAMSMALRLFPQGVTMEKDEIESRFAKYKKWYNDASVIAIMKARESDNAQVILHTKSEWSIGLIYAEKLKDALTHE